MSRNFQGEGMFGIKLVGATHFEHRCFRREGKPPLMNFPDNFEGRRIAAEIPIGHRSLVYLMHPVKRFKAAVEYVKWDSKIDDVLKEGARAAAAQNDAIAVINVLNPKFARIWRCVRIVAWIEDTYQAPPTDFGFQEGDIMLGISQQEYLELYNAVPWSWTEEGN